MLDTISAGWKRSVHNRLAARQLSRDSKAVRREGHVGGKQYITHDGGEVSGEKKHEIPKQMGRDFLHGDRLGPPLYL